MVRLGDVCDILNGYAFKSEEYSDSGFRIIRISNVQKGYVEDTTPVFYPEDNPIVNKYELFENDLLLSLTGNVGRVALLEKEFLPAALNQRVACLRPKKGTAVRTKYLFHILNSDAFEKACILSSKGLAQKNMSTEWLKDYLIPLPSLEKQDEISETLNKVDELISLRKRQLQKLDDLIKSRFIEMFGEPHRSKLHPYCAVSELTDVVSGGTPDRKKAEYWEGGTIPWVKTTELHNTKIIEVEERITEKGLAESSAKIVPANTVLIAMYGQGKTRGMTGYLGIDACTNQACACLLPTGRIDMQYLWYFLILSYDELRGMAQGGNQPNLNAGMIKAFPILVPPIKEQFVSFVSQVERIKAVVQKALDEAQLLLDNLMQKYFG